MITNIASWTRLPLNNSDQVIVKVKQVIDEISHQGDLKIDEYSQQFDGFKPQMIQLKSFDEYDLDKSLKNAIITSAKRIQCFAEFQAPKILKQQFEDELGCYGQTTTAINRIGAYIPGGKCPLISTALMTLIPAKVAGCHTRIACSPSINPAILAAVSLAGATQFWHMGGIPAICAMVLGYQQILPVDLVVGPGNQWVNETKKQLQDRVKIDGLAGPSELLAICDAQQPIEWIAYDALAQSEHDAVACSLVISDDANWLQKLDNFLQSATEFRALVNNQQIQLLLGDSPEALIEFSQSFAPEHLMLCHKQIPASQLTQYGSLFIGVNSAVALGDYISGPNHTLPTQGFARQTGGLSVNTFYKTTTFHSINDQGRIQLSQQAMHLAEAEGLSFHKKSMQIRCE